MSRGGERGGARLLQRGAQLGALGARDCERALGGLGDLGCIRHERGLLGRLAQRHEHRGLLHAPRVGERQPVAVDCDPAELRHVVVAGIVVGPGRAEGAEEHEPALEGVGQHDADDLLARSGERLRGRRSREQLILARHGG